jgi:hypothetical protein
MSSTSDNNIPGPALSASTPSVDPGLLFAFQSLHADEVALAAHLIHLGEQYPSEHEIHHVARDLLTWSRDNIAQIQQLAQQYRVGLGPASEDTALSTCPYRSDVPAGRHPPPADTQPPGERHPRTDRPLPSRTLRQLRWANTMLMTRSPQLLTTL